MLSATGRDIEDQEETLEFDDCRWNRTTNPEQLQFGLLVMLLQKLLRQDVFQGTATELADWLGKEGLLFGPAQLSRYLQSRGRQLAEAGIGLEVPRHTTPNGATKPFFVGCAQIRKLILKAREAFSELASRAFSCVVVKWWSLILEKVVSPG